MISASAVERDFSGAAVAGVTFSGSDMIDDSVDQGKRERLDDENEETDPIRSDELHTT